MAFTVSTSMSRQFSATRAAAVIPMAACASSKNKLFLTPSNFSQLPLKLKPYPKSLCFSSASSSSDAPINPTISVGQKLPDATFAYFDAAGELQTITLSDLTKGKEAFLFAFPGAHFRPYLQKPLPGLFEKYGKLKSKGIEVIGCISVSDASGMKAWKEDLKINHEVLLLSDRNGHFTRAIRSRSYVMLVEDGVVKFLNMEDGGALTNSSHATISVGQKLPDATFFYVDAAGELQTITVADLTKGKKAILFAVPGAFTPTSSQKHLAGLVEKHGELKSEGVDVIACISVGDASLRKAWEKDIKINDELLLLSDCNGDFTRAVRSRSYAMLVEDGVVKGFNMEEGGAFTDSLAEDLVFCLGCLAIICSPKI